MLFETTIPTIITTPISDCTLSVVPVRYSMSSTPVSPVGTASRISNGSTNDRNCATRIRYSSTSGQQQTEAEAAERRLHALHHAAQVDADAFRQLRLRTITLRMPGGRPAEILPGRVHVDVDHPLELVVIDLGRRLEARDLVTASSRVGSLDACRVQRDAAQIEQVADLVFRDTAPSACNRCRSWGRPSSSARSSGSKSAR